MQVDSSPKTKGEQTREKIIRAAIRCLANYGDKDTTFQRIADECGISQPLVVHYLKSRESIFPLVLGQLLEQAKTMTEKALASARSPSDKLKAYLKISLHIFRSEPETARIYLMLHHFASYDERYKSINTQIRKDAVERIELILKAGISTGEFKSVNRPQIYAKTLHNSLVGLLIGIATDSSGLTDKTLLSSLEEILLGPLLM
jgi:AcrR family transcriptional regulator